MPAKPTTPAESVTKLVDLVTRQGKSVREASAAIGVSVPTGYAILLREGYQPAARWTRRRVRAGK